MAGFVLSQGSRTKPGAGEGIRTPRRQRLVAVAGGVEDFAEQNLLVSLQIGLTDFVASSTLALRRILLLEPHPYVEVPWNGLFGFLGGERNPKYPTKLELAFTLLKDFQVNYPSFKVKVIIADAWYGTRDFLDKASVQFGGIQVISQMRCNQNLRYRGKTQSVKSFFNRYATVVQKLSIRGHLPPRQVQMGSARLYVNAHQSKRFVIALQYENESEYRYLIASNLSWRTQDIIQAYTYPESSAA